MGSFGFDGLFDTAFEAVSYIYQRHLVVIGDFRLLDGYKVRRDVVEAIVRLCNLGGT
jgi:hypothetical protein